MAALALTSVQAASNSELATKLSELETQLTEVKKDLKRQHSKINEVKSHDSGDNIKWGADLRTAYDNLNYDMANGDSHGKDSLYSLRLWLNMAYAPDQHNVFKGQLSMNKAFGASFDNPQYRPFDAFDWTSNEALTDNSLKVRQAYWLYLGDKAFGADMPWTFSLGRRPSTNGFLASLSQDDPAQSPLGHLINLEFDGLSSKLDLSRVTGVQGMSIKLCMGYGSTNAAPLIGSPTPNADVEDNGLEDITLAGLIFEPYNNGQYIVKATAYQSYDLPEAKFDSTGNMTGFEQVGDMQGAGLSVMIDGLGDSDFLFDTKVFGSFAWTKSDPAATKTMLGQMDGSSETGTSYWFGAYLPVTDGENNYGKVGLEYNHGSQYWRPFTYAEDTMVGSKIAARGDAWEANYTYQINEALSMQLRYVNIDYDYAGSNGFFGSTTGNAMSIDDIKANAAWGQGYLAANPTADPETDPTAAQAYGAIGMAANTIEKSSDFRMYLRYRF